MSLFFQVVSKQKGKCKGCGSHRVGVALGVGGLDVYLARVQSGRVGGFSWCLAKVGLKKFCGTLSSTKNISL